jgi:hypothetical protein
MRCDREESLSSLRMPPIISGKMIRMVSRYVGGESSQVLEAICIVNEVPAKDSDNAFDVSRGYGHISDGLKRATSGKRETHGCRFSLVDAYYLANSS